MAVLRLNASAAIEMTSTLVGRSPAEQALPVDGTQADNYSKLPAPYVIPAGSAGRPR
jgi:hypothetical protein